MPEQPDLLDTGRNQNVLTVSQLNAQARVLLEERFAMVWVQGEVSNLKRASSGHVYFTLKDAGAQLRCVMFRSRSQQLRFRLEDGLEAIVRANISLYEDRGEYQAVVQAVQPAGDGALRLAFDQLKARLEAEGLFAPERKRALPYLPRHIAIVTARGGAALRDMLAVADRRNRMARITLLSVKVQGDSAPPSICAALAALPRLADVDLVICGRGGGSLEDLWAFNDERVARALAEVSVPVISAVGHEVDITIADLVADVRAPTPSAAMELALPDQTELAQRVAALEQRLVRGEQNLLAQAGELSNRLRHRLEVQAPRLQNAAQRVDALELRLQRAHARQRDALATRLSHLRSRLKHPGQRLHEQRQRTQQLQDRLQRALRARLTDRKRDLAQVRQRLDPPTTRLSQGRSRLEALNARLLRGIRDACNSRHARLAAAARALQSVSPLDTLQRGYAIVVQPQDDGPGIPVTDASRVAVGERLVAQLARGRLECRVEATLSGPDADPLSIPLNDNHQEDR